MTVSLLPALHKIFMRREGSQGAAEHVEPHCGRRAKSPPQFRQVVYVIVEQSLSKDLVYHRAIGPRNRARRSRAMDQLIWKIHDVSGAQRNASGISNRVQPPLQHLASIRLRRVPKPGPHSFRGRFGEFRLDRHHGRTRDDHEISVGSLAPSTLNRDRVFEAQVYRREKSDPDSGAKLNKATYWRPPKVHQGHR